MARLDLKKRRRPERLPVPPVTAAQVTAELERDPHRAVELARRHHATDPSAASEGLLVRAFVSRVRLTAERGQVEDARALLKRVRAEHAAFVDQTDEVELELALRAGDMSVLAAHLACPHDRNSPDDAIRRYLLDLSALASASLPPAAGPLQTAARALHEAFDMVTRQPTTDEQLALPEVSRRSPLASWKPLVRAIAAYYRGDDGGCESHLGAIQSDAAVARLVPAIRAMLGGTISRLETASQALVEAVVARPVRLRDLLARCDAVVLDGNGKAALTTFAEAVEACPSEQVGTLRQHLAIRFAMLGIEPARATRALGGRPPRTATFWRLLAQGLQTDPEPAGRAQASAYWQLFQRHAVAEGWFAERSAESSAVLLHAAELMADVVLPGSRQRLTESLTRALWQDYEAEPAEIKAASRLGGKQGEPLSLDAGGLFRRACEADPHPDAFSRWLAGADGTPQAIEAANAWRAASPDDVRPILHLLKSAETRGAHKQAVELCAQAEKANALHPEVRAARIRLDIAACVRHLRARKGHLAEKVAARLAVAMESRAGHLAIFPAAVRWAVHVQDGDRTRAAACFDEAVRVAGSTQTARFVLGALAEQARLGGGAEAHLKAAGPPETMSPVHAVARACWIGEQTGLAVKLPADRRALMKGLKAGAEGVDAPSLQAFGRAALRSRWHEGAWQATVAGLRAHPTQLGHFLLLRAQTLPDGDRRADCLLAAIELGRRDGDASLVDDAMKMRDASDDAMFFGLPVSARDRLKPEELEEVIERERADARFNIRSTRRSAAFGGMPGLGDLLADAAAHGVNLEDLFEAMLESTEPPKKRKKKYSDDIPF